MRDLAGEFGCDGQMRQSDGRSARVSMNVGEGSVSASNLSGETLVFERLRRERVESIKNLGYQRMLAGQNKRLLANQMEISDGIQKRQRYNLVVWVYL